MTPQLRQAIKLLQYSNLEAASFVEEELERNPLLERDESIETGVGERPAPDQVVIDTIRPTDAVSAATAETLPSEAAAPLNESVLMARLRGVAGSNFPRSTDALWNQIFGRQLYGLGNPTAFALGANPLGVGGEGGRGGQFCW